MSPLTTNIRVEVAPSVSPDFPGYNVLAVRTRKNGALSSIDKLVIKPFIRPRVDATQFGRAKTIEALRHEANDHATGVAEIFGVLDVRLAGPTQPDAAEVAHEGDHHS